MKLELIHYKDKEGHSSDIVSGKDWLKYSVSVWDDTKTTEEKKYKHPASFPVEMIKKLIKLYSKKEEIVLDPFAGIGSTLLAATEMGRRAVGYEINGEYISVIEKRLTNYPSMYQINKQSCIHIGESLNPNTVDFCITSPPYWNILNRSRTADKKDSRNYGNGDGDLGNIDDYNDFLVQLKIVLQNIFKVLKPYKHCVLVVMDIRKRKEFFPLHIDVTNLMKEIGFQLEDYIIWDRRMDYNNLRPLGYPSVFRVNKVHEYICIFKKNGEVK